MKHDAPTCQTDWPQKDWPPDWPCRPPFRGGVWARARWHLGQILNVSGGPALILAEGLPAGAARHLRNWLMAVEALVRHLVVAAAMGLKLVLPAASARTSRSGAPPASAARLSADKADPRTWRVGFAWLRPGVLSPAQRATAATAPAPTDAQQDKPWAGCFARHWPGTAEPVLPLRPPARMISHTGDAPRSATHERRPPRSRWDPTNTFSKHEDDTYFLRDFPAPRPRNTPGRSPDSNIWPNTPRPHKTRAEKYADWIDGHPPPWRIAQPVCPAPADRSASAPCADVAARIEALRRVLADPMTFVQRLARRLARHPALLDAFGDRPLEEPPKGAPALTLGAERLIASDWRGEAWARRMNDTS